MKVELIFSEGRASIRIQADDDRDKSLLTAFNVERGSMFRIDEERVDSHHYGRVITKSLMLHPVPHADLPTGPVNFIKPEDHLRLLEIEAAATALCNYVQGTTPTAEMVPQWADLKRAMRRRAP